MTTIRLLARAGLALALLALLGWGLWAASQPDPVRLYGEIEVRELRAAAKIAGRVDSVQVQTGDQVQQGDLLFSIDSPELRARHEQALAALEAAEAQASKADAGARSQEIEMARRNWESASAQAELAAATHERLQMLHAEGLISRQDYEEARTRRDASARQAEAAHAQYDMAQEGARTEDRSASQAQVRQARGALAEVEAALADTRIYAPADGEVAQVLTRTGELAPAGFPVVSLLDPNEIKAVMMVREDRLPHFRVGSTFIANIPALDQDVTFRVTGTRPLPDFATWRQAGDQKLHLRTFEIEARPETATEGLRPGLSLIVELAP